MSGKFLARASALSLAVFLAACGGDENSTPIVNVNTGQDDTTTGGETTSPDDTNTDDTGTGGTVSVALGVGSGDGFTQGLINASTTQLSGGDSDELIPGGNALLEVFIVDPRNGNALVTGEELSVTFTSSCLDQERATLSANPVTVTSGIAKTTYTADGCSGEDLVTARIQNAEASVALKIAASEPLAFVTFPPEPNSIAPTDTSGNSEDSRAPVSDVSFQLIDDNRDGVEEHTVKFELFPEASSASLARDTETTDLNGFVTAVVRAGSRHEVVRVIASTTDSEGKTIATTSAPIAINSYIPTEQNFSVALDSFLPDAWKINGVPVQVRVDAADRMGNAIRGNTIINFTTSNGKITPDCELDETGTCTVTWESLNTREARPEIVAYTQGERLVSGSDCHIPSNDCTYEFATLQQIATLAQTTSEDIEVVLTNTSGNEYCATASSTITLADNTEIQLPPPSGTTIEFTATGGTIINESQASKTIGSGRNLVSKSAYQACVNAEATPDTTEASILKVIATPPNGNPDEDFVSL